jgi:hypothetical protein
VEANEDKMGIFGVFFLKRICFGEGVGFWWVSCSWGVLVDAFAVLELDMFGLVQCFGE